MTANNLERAMLIEAVDKEREGRRASLLPFPSRTMMARPSTDRQEKLRILEALLFAAPEPLDQAELARHFAEGEDIRLAAHGVADPLCRARRQSRARRRQMGLPHRRRPRLSARARGRRAAPPVARGARDARRSSPITSRSPAPRSRRSAASAPRKAPSTCCSKPAGSSSAGRRRAPGRPVTYGTTEQFLGHFGFDSIQDLPGLSELKGAGLLDSTLPPASPCPIPTTLRSCARTRIRSRTSLARTMRPPKATRTSRRADRSRLHFQSQHRRSASCLSS